MQVRCEVGNRKAMREETPGGAPLISSDFHNINFLTTFTNAPETKSSHIAFIITGTNTTVHLVLHLSLAGG